MKLAQIFTKPIDRPIEGVIKADDDQSLRVEVDEYVVTNEIAKRLEDFLADYTHYENANGVWISGFFGSGKSHLLKMLALILANEPIDGMNVLEAFLGKLGIADNAILQGELKRAATIPSQSILFNIDQKADAITKQQADALLAVFVKVFNEACGYYGKQPYIAQFERDLDRRGEYAAFRAAYAEVAGRPWKRGREQVVLEGANIARAYARAADTSEENARGILDKYRSDYKLSIEDFANQVNDHIVAQEPDFRLNFFVDEVGQYIAENTKLMTNLQTIAESLNTKCRGRSWIVVTAQEEMDTVVGEMGKQQSYDFSKIQARFANRMKLTSANVDEVINRRLLAKNEDGIQLLIDLYAAHQSNLRTLFEFGDGSRTYRIYRDRDEFIATYPFAPYQYALFQSAIQNLSQHNAFEGRHSSVGERSMLSVFQHVVKAIADQDINTLATFDRMYAGIQSTLKGQLTGSIRAAEAQDLDPFAVRVLKALFLVKYVKEFKATAGNVAILLIDRFDIDINAHRKRVQAALNTLESQSYIQRSGDEYAYLTDEEKDIEQEIKALDVDTASVREQLAKLIFDGVLKGDRKIRHADQFDYPFSRKLDGVLLGREQELSVHIISPFYEHAGDDEILHAHSLGRDELYVILPPDERLMVDLRLYLQTEKFVQQNLGTTQVQSRREILINKREQNRTRGAAVTLRIEELLKESTLLVSGRTLELSSTDPRTRIIQGFQDLIARTYANLGMLRGQSFAADRLADYLSPDRSFLGSDPANVPESDQEMLGYIKMQMATGVRPTVQKLVRHFESKPYGWYLAAIQCILARLVARGQVEVRRDGNVLDNDALVQALANTHAFANLILEPQTDIPPARVRALKDFYNDFFDAPPHATEPRALGQEVAQKFGELADELPVYLQQAEHFPFLTQLSQLAEQVEAYVAKPYAFYFEELPDHQDALLDAKDDVLAPIRNFMVGGQREIYLAARRFLHDQAANLSYLDYAPAVELAQALDDPRCYAGNRMTQVKSLLDQLTAAVDRLLAHERAAAIQRLDERWQPLAVMPEFAALTPEQQAQLRRPFDALKSSLAQQTLAAVIREAVNAFLQTEYPTVLSRLTAWSQAPAPTPVQHGEVGGASVEERVDADGDGAAKQEDVPSPRAVTYTPLAGLLPHVGSLWLADEEDVDAYLDALRRAMLEAIGDGKRIQL